MLQLDSTKHPMRKQYLPACPAGTLYTICEPAYVLPASSVLQASLFCATSTKS